MKVNSLEQQLGRSRDETKLLRRQVNEAGQRVQAEEQKNRALKGEGGRQKTDKEFKNDVEK